MQDKPVASAELLRSAWLRIGQRADAPRLFAETGLAPDQVVQFYESLSAAPDVRGAFETVPGRARPSRAAAFAASGQREPVGRIAVMQWPEPSRYVTIDQFWDHPWANRAQRQKAVCRFSC